MTKAVERHTELNVGSASLALPCFYPSVSSVKTNMMPVDYVELLHAADHSLFLTSAYDVAQCGDDDRMRIESALTQSKEQGAVILMDSGNYEGYWKGDQNWSPEHFHRIATTSQYNLCFCHDNQDPPDDATEIAAEVVSSVLRDQEHAIGTVVPIVHGAAALLPMAVKLVAEQLFPVMLAVPERDLGEGILERLRTVRRIRDSLDSVGTFIPLHLLGTGNPLSINCYSIAGADSFDGLEWCQTVVDHDTGRLSHFQHWDIFRHQTKWGSDSPLPYIQSVLMHNLEFYKSFMAGLRDAIHGDGASAFLRNYASEQRARNLEIAIEGADP